MGIQVKARVYSKIGPYRKKNEDNFLFQDKYLSSEHKNKSVGLKSTLDKPYLFAVCDGMGGTLDGNIASYLAVQSLKEHFGASQRTLQGTDIADLINKIINSVNEDICSFSKSKERKLGSTIALLYIDANELIVSNVGDSRVYQLFEGELIQLTKDHNQANFMYEAGLLKKEEIKNHKGRHKLTQYLGIHSDEMIIDPDTKVIHHNRSKTIYLLCSDGLVEALEDEAIKYILQQKISLKRRVDKLVKTALNEGSKDNVTAIVIEII